MQINDSCIELVYGILTDKTEHPEVQHTKMKVKY